MQTAPWNRDTGSSSYFPKSRFSREMIVWHNLGCDSEISAFW